MGKKTLLKMLIAYVIIVFFGSFIDYPLFALIAVPFFLGGIIWMLMLMLNSPVIHPSKRNLSTGLIVASIMLMAVSIFLVINTLMSYYGTMEFMKGEMDHPLSSYILPVVLAVFSAICIAAGIRIRTGWKQTAVVFGSLALIAPFLSLFFFWLVHALI